MGARPGPKPKPELSIVREGNPGKRPIKEGAKLPPSCPDEPSWVTWFPATSGAQAPDNQLCRDTAKAVWAEVVPVLDRQGLLASVDTTVLVDLCVCVARIRQCERNISSRGLWVHSERGAVKNPAATIVNGYRTQLRAYVAELGLSPSARVRLEGSGGDSDGEDGPFEV